MARKTAPLPSKDELLKYIQETPGRVGKREIARAFHLDGSQRVELKRLLRELEDEGQLERGRGRRFAEPGTLPEVTVLVITGTDLDGEVLAKPANWDEDANGEAPKIYMAPEKPGQQALGPGDKVLARLSRTGKTEYSGKTIRRLASAPSTVLGIYKSGSRGGRLEPTDRRAKGELQIAPGDQGGAEDGDLVRAEVLPGRKLGLRRGKVIERLDSLDHPKALSLITLHDHEIPTEFSPEALDQARRAGPAPLGDRVDLRDVPLVTIDGADARDFDDAVFAEPMGDPENPEGWHLIVAIADVSWYVRPNDGLDREAYKRGTSVYFPDRVVPMLPEEISNGWCSLVPKEDRPCLAAHLWIDAQGKLQKHKFFRGLMRSQARLTYEQVQAARDGQADDATDPLVDGVINPLYGAYEALERYRASRHTLELDLPERRVMVDENGDVTGISTRDRLDSHKLIEEFMITANVAAAETLEKLHLPCMYRVHDQPSMEKIEALAEFLETLDISFNKGQTPSPRQFNGILSQVRETPKQDMVNQVILRSQSQAEYTPSNIGHFGLALRRYSHFTSPIRRYPDLLVHRALVRGLKLGDGALEPDHKDFEEMGEALSSLERRAAAAERDTVDRYTAAYLSDREGATFAGRINGVTRFGLFVTLDETGADGLVPISSLPDDFYDHDEGGHCLVGRRTGRSFTLGETVEVLLVEARPITGGMVFQLLDGGGRASRSKGRPGQKGKAGGSGKPRPKLKRGTKKPRSRAGRRQSR